MIGKTSLMLTDTIGLRDVSTVAWDENSRDLILSEDNHRSSALRPELQKTDELLPI